MKLASYSLSELCGVFLSLCPLCFDILQNANEKSEWPKQWIQVLPIIFKAPGQNNKQPQSLNAGTALPNFFLIIGSSDILRDMWNLSLYPTFVI